MESVRFALLPGGANCANVSPHGKTLPPSETLNLTSKVPATVVSPPSSRASSSTRAVERALGLLSEVCAEGTISLTDCARRVDLPTSTALRLLRTLESADFVARDQRGFFRAGARLIQLGAAALGRESLVGMAEPALQRIVAETGESAYVSVLGPGDTALYVAMVEGTHAVRHTSWVGRTVTLEGSAVGSALRGRVSAEGYVAQRSTVEPDVTAIAAPIWRPGGIAGAVSLVGPTYRIDDDTLSSFGQIVSREAGAIAEQFGASQSVGA
jgi:IclR family acetate operon transcriptional repressor